jgi:hypothetical protein
MGKKNKPMPKDSNSKFTTRNNKQDIFSKFTKPLKPKVDLDKLTKDVSKPEPDNPNS